MALRYAAYSEPQTPRIENLSVNQLEQEVVMKRLVPVTLLVLALTIGGASALVFSSGSGGEEFDVTVTNLTRGQQFTPILVASHEAGVNLFTLGDRQVVRWQPWLKQETPVH